MTHFTFAEKSMNRFAFLSAVSLLVAPAIAFAAPNAGTYTTTDIGGQMLTGRASTWRPGINSGLPHVLHAQSWNGTTLGTQWELRCAVENNAFSVQDNRVGGVGTVVYTSQFTGGQFELFNTGGAWGDGVANLGTTVVITTVQFIMISGNSTPVASVVNANTSGDFGGGCTLTFAISNGVGVGETSSLNPSLVKPADYPVFQDASCAAAPANAQFGTWGTTITSTMRIDCSVPATSSTWGAVKNIYR
jgi:hypothetical protein